MKKLLVIIALAIAAGLAFALAQGGLPGQKAPTFDDAIEIIKEFEGISGKRHWPFVGYGHKVTKGDKYKRGTVLTQAQAEELARKDYAKLCALYREYGADSLLLAALAYNCGPGTVAKSSVLAKLKAGDRDIEAAYTAHCKYRGKQLKQLKRRRETELAALFVKNPTTEIAEHEEKTENDEKGIKNDSTLMLAAGSGANSGMR